MIRNSKMAVVTIILIMMVCVLTGCDKKATSGGSTDANSTQGSQKQNDHMKEWSNEALKVSFLYPKGGNAAFHHSQYGAEVAVHGGSAITVELRVSANLSPDNSPFQTKMEKDFKAKSSKESGYQEVNRKFLDIDGYPAALLHYKALRGDSYCNFIELTAQRGNYEYQLINMFFDSSDYAKNEALAMESINSLHLMKGMANLAAAEVKESGKLANWSNDALKVSFSYPEGNQISVKDGVVSIDGLNTEMGLECQYIQPSMDNGTAKVYMDESIKNMVKNAGYTENKREYYLVDNCPAVCVDFMSTSGGGELHHQMLLAAKDGYIYGFRISYASDDTKSSSMAAEIIKSFHFIAGTPNLETLK